MSRRNVITIYRKWVFYQNVAESLHPNEIEQEHNIFKYRNDKAIILVVHPGAAPLNVPRFSKNSWVAFPALRGAYKHVQV